MPLQGIEEIEEQGWSLNLGHYVGVAEWGNDVNFQVRLKDLYEQLELLNAKSKDLEP